VYLVIDGVDECSDRQQQGFLKSLIKASEVSGVNLKLMICSRPETDISLDLEDLPQIKVEEYNAEDIREHANTQLQSLPGWTASERNLACDEIVKKAGSFFRYVEVAISILRQPWQRPIENKLKELPEGLNNIYSQVLRKTNPEYVGLLRTCLLWTILAEDEYVKVAEIVDAYSHPYSQDDQEAFNDGDSDGKYSKLYQEQVTIAGGSFIDVDSKTAAISLRHNTVADYFLDEKRVEEFEEQSSHHACNMCERCQASLNGRDPFLITKKHGHLEVATIIFQHLNSPAFRRKFYPPEEVSLHPTEESSEGSEKADKQDEQSESPPAEKTKGPEDTETKGPEDIKTNGPEDTKTNGPEDTKTNGPEDTKTNGPEDTKTEASESTESTEPPKPLAVATTNGVGDVSTESESVDQRDFSTQEKQSAETNGEKDQPKENGTSPVPEIKVSDAASNNTPEKAPDDGVLDSDAPQTNGEVKVNGTAGKVEPDSGKNKAAEVRVGFVMPPDDASVIDSDAGFKQPPGFGGGEVDGDSDSEESDARYEIVYSNFHLRESERLWSEEERAGPAWEGLWKELDAFWAEGPAFRQWAKLKCSYSFTPYFTEEGPNITPLHFGASNVLPSLTARLLERGDDVNAATSSGRQALHFAADWEIIDLPEDQIRKTAVLKLLLGKGASPNAADNYLPPLSVLLLRNPILEDVRLFLDNPAEKANCQFQDIWGKYPLHHVAERGTYVDVLMALLEAGADINGKDTWGNAPLHRLVWRQDLPEGLLDAFLSNGADVNMDDNNSERPLYVACAHGNTEAARVLIDAGADIEDDNMSGATAIHGAAFNSQVGAAHLLVERGANLARCDNKGRLALHAACENDSPDVGLLLMDAMLKNGQDINQATKRGKTVLRKACARGHVELVRMLLDNVDDPVQAINSTDPSFCQTGLHAAAYKGHDDIVRLLISRGAETNIRDKQDRTPLALCYRTWGGMDSTGFEPVLIQLIDREPDEARNDQELLNTAAIQGSVAVIQKLLQLGVDPNRRDEHGWTAVQLAKRYGRTEAAEALGSGAVFRLKPTRWTSGGTEGFTVSEDGLTVNSNMPEENPVYSFFSDHPVPADVEHYYFEVDIAKPNKEDKVAFVGIGFSQRPLKTGKSWFPGLIPAENPGIATWGYHGDDGLHQHPPNSALPEQVTFDNGDTVGCGVDFKDGEIFITKNGERLRKFSRTCSRRRS
jgi:ankyrin repeat protein